MHVPDRRALPPAARLLARRRSRGRRGDVSSASARRLRRLVARGATPAGMAAAAARAFFDALADDFNTPTALAALCEWIREANRPRRGAVGDRDLREMLGVLGLGEPAGRAGDVGAVDPRRSGCCERREQARAAARLRRRRPAARADRARSAGRSATGPAVGASISLAGCDRLRAQPRPRGAARAPRARRAGTCWATASAAREPWLAGVRVRIAVRRGDRAALRLARAPGRLRGGWRLSLRLGRASCWRAQTR